MQADSATRVLLALILVCLVILIAQGGLDGGDSGAPGWGRFAVTGMRAGAPMLIRTDTVTGEVWKLELRGGGNKWVAFKEPGVAATQAKLKREPREAPGETARATREIIEPPGAPGLTAKPPRPTAASLAALAAHAKREKAPLTVSDIETFAKALQRDALPGDLRAWSAKQLGAIDDPKSTEALLGALDDPDPVVVAAALRALTSRSDDRVKAAAKKATAHSDEAVRRAAQATLASLD